MPAVIREERDGILTLTLNRPEARNAIDPETAVRLGEGFRDYAGDDGLRCAIVTGAGDAAFCSGADLARTIPLFTGVRKAEDEWDEKLLADPSLFQWALLRSVDLFKPVIAKVNGYCIAGGLEMMQGTDIRVAAKHASFALQEPKWGLFPGGGSTVRLPRQIPYCKAMEILLTGERLTAVEAFQWGLVNYVVPASQVAAKVDTIARAIVENGPLAVRKIKESVIRLRGLPEAEALAREPEFAMPVFASEDAKEGPRAFKEKRRPKFTGR
jgi:enoyl-CoA hydratase